MTDLSEKPTTPKIFRAPTDSKRKKSGYQDGSKSFDLTLGSIADNIGTKQMMSQTMRTNRKSVKSVRHDSRRIDREKYNEEEKKSDK